LSIKGEKRIASGLYLVIRKSYSRGGGGTRGAGQNRFMSNSITSSRCSEPKSKEKKKLPLVKKGKGSILALSQNSAQLLDHRLERGENGWAIDPRRMGGGKLESTRRRYSY